MSLMIAAFGMMGLAYGRMGLVTQKHASGGGNVGPGGIGSPMGLLLALTHSS